MISSDAPAAEFREPETRMGRMAVRLVLHADMVVYRK